MKRMHSLLKRQISRHLGDMDAILKGWEAMLNDVNITYRQMDLDRNVLESSLEMTSQELFQAHAEMNAAFQAFPDLLFRTDLLGTILDHQTNKEGNRRYKISISMGATHYDPENPCSHNEIMSRADKMIYKHKKSKKS